MPKRTAGRAPRMGLALADVGTATSRGQLVPLGERAGHGRTMGQLGDVEQRLGTYNPERISQGTFAKMERHFTIRIGLALIYLPLLKVGWKLKGDDPRVNALVKAVLTPIWGSTVKSCARTGVSRGCAPHEQVNEHTDRIRLLDLENGIDELTSGWTIAKIKDIDPGSLQSITIDGLENFAGYKLSVPSGMELASDKCFHFVNELAFGNWWGTSRLVGAYDPWYRHTLLWDQAMRYMERRGTPATHVSFPPGKDTDGNDNATMAAAIAGGMTTDDVAFWTPSSKQGDPGWSIDYVKDDQRAQGFLEMLNAHASWMLRSLLIPDEVVTSTEVGSQAKATVHADMFADGEEGLLTEICEAVSDQLIPRIVRYNFGPNVEPPRLVPDAMGEQEKQYAAEVFKLAVVGGQAPIAIAKLANMVGIPVLEEEPTPPEPAPPEAGAVPDAPVDPATLADLTSDLRDIVRLGRLQLAVRGGA